MPSSWARCLATLLLATARAQTPPPASPPPAPPVPDSSSGFGCWFYFSRACDDGRDSWRTVDAWQWDHWGMENNQSDTEYRCEHGSRATNFINWCYFQTFPTEARPRLPFRFRSGVLGYQLGGQTEGVPATLSLDSNHTAIVDGYDATGVTYLNVSTYPQAGVVLVRSNTLQVAEADVGGYTRHHGVVYVSGGTFRVTGDMRLGRQGHAELRQTGGSFVVDGTLAAASHGTGTGLVHQTGGTMTVGTFKLGSTASHAHLLVRGTASVQYLTLRDDYSTISTGSHKTRILVADGGVLTVTEKLDIDTIHDQIELRGGQLAIGKLWQTYVEPDLSKTFLTMYRDASLLLYTSNPNNNNPCDSSGTLGQWYVNNFLDPAYTSQANKNFRPVLGEDPAVYEIRSRCVSNTASATGYAMEAYVALK